MRKPRKPGWLTNAARHENAPGVVILERRTRFSPSRRKMGLSARLCQAADQLRSGGAVQGVIEPESLAEVAAQGM